MLLLDSQCLAGNDDEKHTFSWLADYDDNLILSWLDSVASETVTTMVATPNSPDMEFSSEADWVRNEKYMTSTEGPTRQRSEQTSDDEGL